MSETEILGRLAAVEQLAVLSFGVVIAADRSPDAKEKGLGLLRFAVDDLGKDRGMNPEIRREALAAFDEIASKVSEALNQLRP